MVAVGTLKRFYFPSLWSLAYSRCFVRFERDIWAACINFFFPFSGIILFMKLMSSSSDSYIVTWGSFSNCNHKDEPREVTTDSDLQRRWAHQSKIILNNEHIFQWFCTVESHSRFCSCAKLTTSLVIQSWLEQELVIGTCTETIIWFWFSLFVH